ncbi:MAG: ribonuclease D [Ardenticatenaceae bacterium]|nr:ribonuclease D [Ardenticatenaceae bacterium]
MLVPLPPHHLITAQTDWQDCLAALKQEPRIAIDLEANSMYAYRERVCLIQISIPSQDYIIDPVAKVDLSGLGELLADTAVEKVFHAAEYDLILLKREYEWELNNLFDTMWAARILGYKQYGLASLLKKIFDLKLDKQYQKSNWCRRPLSPAQLAYAQHDTHHLLQLRDYLHAELQAANRLVEAQEIFLEQTKVQPGNHEFDPDSFWSIHGVHELSGEQRAILKAINIYRDQEAQKRNQPLFKIFGDRTMIELARQTPKSFGELQQVYGMSSGQIRRYGKQLLQLIADNQDAAPPRQPKRPSRPPDDVLCRYEKLHNWRKHRAQKRGVESDVILSRETLWAIARQNPRSTEELAQLAEIGAWRCQAYGDDIIKLLSNHQQ